ncbi:MAG: hypothetical protein EOO16_09490 [Chitinophagaceae bacterium]|nr:MAG: hypothetical protein EOO16_09490 [Chitinophagaceae bacterium]
MRRIFVLLFLLGVSLSALARKFDFTLHNLSDKSLAVYVQLYKGAEFSEQRLWVTLNPNETKQLEYKLSKNERIRIVGNYQDRYTLPVDRLYDSLSSGNNEVRMILPASERARTAQLVDVVQKMQSDPLLRPLADSMRFLRGELPPLGTFVFYNQKDRSAQLLLPTYWKNEGGTYRSEPLNQSASFLLAAPRTEGMAPQFSALLSSLSGTALMELRWDLTNVHLEQWQAAGKNPLQIIQDPSLEYFLRACMTEILEKKLGSSDYQLLFVSGMQLADKVVVSARRYTPRTVGEDFPFAATDQEVALPEDTASKTFFVRPRLLQPADSVSGLAYKVQGLDVTPALAAFIADQDKSALKSAEAKLESIKTDIGDIYSTLQGIDSTLQRTYSITVIASLVESMTDVTLRTIAEDKAGKPAGAADEAFNRKAAQFNALLATAKQRVAKYKEVQQMVEKMNDPNKPEAPKVFLSNTLLELPAELLRACRGARR